MPVIEKIKPIIKSIVPPHLPPKGYLERLTLRKCQFTVRSGPFAGMRYIRESVHSAYIPKVLGIYERELHATVEAACSLRCSLIVDVGAAEGYYAVGMALRNPEARIEAFEMNASGQRALRMMAGINGAQARIRINGKCEADDLHRLLLSANGKKLVICDTEGYEQHLIDPVAVPALASSYALVEMHDFIIPGLTSLLMERMNKTHRITHFWQEPRSPTEYPFSTVVTRLLPQRYLRWTVNEGRPAKMSWLWMEPIN